MMDGRGSARVVVGVVHTEEDEEEEEGCAPWGADTPAPQWAATGAAGERAAEDFLVPTLEGLLRGRGTPDGSDDDDEACEPRAGLFGAGTLFGVQVMPEGYLPMDILVKPAGGFIVLGLTLALMNKLLPKKA